MLTHKEDGYETSFVTTLVVLPAIIAIIILLIGSNIARAFSLVAVFSLIRFRSAVNDLKDITYVLMTVCIGLTAGMGYIGYSIIFAVILCMALYLLDKTNYGKSKRKAILLRIVIPENLNYQKVFDDIFTTYTDSFALNKVKTSDLGSLVTLTYKINFKKDTNLKLFIDQIRQRNGNLDVTLTLNPLGKCN